MQDQEKELKRVVSPIYSLEKKKPVSPIYFLGEQKEPEPPIYFLEPKRAVLETKEDPAGREEGTTVVTVPMTKNVYSREGQILADQLIRAAKGDDTVELGIPANYRLIPNIKQIYIDRKGERNVKREEFICQIIIDEFEKDSFTILTSDISKIVQIVGQRYASATIDYTAKKPEKVIENSFRDACKYAFVYSIYYEAGWQMIDGKHVYVHDALKLPLGKFARTGLSLPFYDYTPWQIADIFFKACTLYRERDQISVMLSFSLLGVLYRLFSEAGHTPHFLLFISGKTGSMKTALSKILYTQVADENHREEPRRIGMDTITSFERGIVMGGCDTVTLIDDYAPAKTKSEKADLQGKLESIIRMVGDGATKSRSNVSLEDRRGEGVKGAVVLTGEIQGKGLSSNLRCFYCGIRRECVNEEVATEFQQTPYLFTTFVQHFANFVSRVWDDIIQHIQTSFDSQRREVKKVLSERRLIDSAVTLRIICEILREFLVEYCGVNRTIACERTKEMKEGIVRMALISNHVSQEEGMSLQFAKIIEELLQSNQIILHVGRPNENQAVCIDGFEDEKYYYFLPTNLYAHIKRTISLTGMYLSVDLNELVKILYDEGLLVASSNGASKKTYYARIDLGSGKKRNFIKIKKAKLKEMCEEVF